MRHRGGSLRHYRNRLRRLARRLDWWTVVAATVIVFGEFALFMTKVA